MPLDIKPLMSELARSHASFRNEADFRDSLVANLPERISWKTEVQLRKPGGDFTDIVGFDESKPFAAFELKYNPRTGAGISSRIDFMNDLGRLEEVLALDSSCECHAILLTSDSTMWLGAPLRDDPRMNLVDVLNVWPSFAEGDFLPEIHGQYLAEWGRGNKGYTPFMFRHKGTWTNFWPAEGARPEFRYLHVPVKIESGT
jgi:hypothetical protein